MDRDSRYADCEVLADGSLSLPLAPSASPYPNAQLHIVATGDRLDVLAYRYYGNASLWWVIMEANAVAFPLELTPGTVLAVPSLNALIM